MQPSFVFSSGCKKPLCYLKYYIKGTTMADSRFRSLIRGKNVVYITVKDSDYIRTSQIRRILEKECKSIKVYSSEKRGPIGRALDIRRRIGKIDFSGVDVVILGFLPQLIWSAVEKRLGRENPTASAAGKDAQIDGTGTAAGKAPALVSEFFLSLYDTVVLDRRIVEDGHIVALKLRKLDLLALNGASLVLTDTRANGDFLSSLYDIDRDKFETLYLEADPEIYPPVTADAEAVIKESENAAKGVGAGNGAGTDAGASKETLPVRTVLYFGTGLPLQGTDIVMGAFNRVAGEDGAGDGAGAKSVTKCVFIGRTRGIPKPELIKARNNPNIEIIHWLSQRALSERIKSADLCIAGHFCLYIDKASRTIPGKAFIYEAMRKPMILGDTRANRELFSQDSRHFFIPRGSEEALAECIRNFQ